MSKSGSGDSKTRLVADLTEEYRKLNLTLQQTRDLSSNVATEMGKFAAPDGHGGGGGHAGGGGGGGYVPGSHAAATGGGGGGGFLSTLNSSSKAWAGTSSDQYIQNEMLRKSGAFFAGYPNKQTDRGLFTLSTNQGETFADQVIKPMQLGGTATSVLDAANAVAFGNANGLMSGLKNYNTISQSAQTISNVMPGVGLQGGMQATAALNSAGSVNRLRMIGIQVRNSNGLMRGVEDIARDLWNSINAQKTGNKKITAEDLSMSLQPGMSLDSLLNQYFGGDAVLREAVVKSLYQFAGGGTLSKESLENTGALPGVAKSISDTLSANYDKVNAYTQSGVQGLMTGNGIQIFWQELQANTKMIGDVFTWLKTFFEGAGGKGLTGGEARPGGGQTGYGIGGGTQSDYGIGGDSSGTYSPISGSSRIVSGGHYGDVRMLNINGKLTKNGPHRGNDYAVPEGTPVHAAKDGTVVETGNNPGGFGNYVVLQHDDGYQTVYGHLSQKYVSKGQAGKISAGTVIGLSGNTGLSTGPHLHFQVQTGRNGKTINPDRYLSGAMDAKTNTTTKAGVKAQSTLLGMMSAGKLFSSEGSLAVGDISAGTAGSGIGGGAESVGPSGMRAHGGHGGNLVVNINLPAGSALNEHKLAREVKRVLEEERLIRTAVTR